MRRYETSWGFGPTTMGIGKEPDPPSVATAVKSIECKATIVRKQKRKNHNIDRLK
jgi:hypothetical protein